MRRPAWITLAAAAALSGGCGSAASPIAKPVEPRSARFLPAPKGAVFQSPVWIGGERRLVVMLVPPGKGTDGAYDHLYSLRPDGTALRRLPLPTQPGCKLTSQGAPVALARGRVSYLQECWGQEFPHNAKYLRTFDLASGRVGYLRRYSLIVSAGVFAVGPRGEVVVNDGRGLSERLLRLTATHAVPIALPFLRAGYPSWSPDGKRIAIDAVPSSEHANGVARLDLSRNLYLLDADGHVRRLLARGLLDAGRAAWSPNGRWLALRLDPAHGHVGLYLVNVATGSVHLVREGDYGAATWITNREIVAALGVSSDLPGGRGRAGLELIQLPALG